jgi:hypothetical protein
MLFMQKKRSRFGCGIAIGMIAAFSIVGSMAMSNRVVRKEISREVSRLKYACRDIIDSIN